MAPEANFPYWGKEPHIQLPVWPRVTLWTILVVPALSLHWGEDMKEGSWDGDFTAVGSGPLLSLTKSKSGGLQGSTHFGKLWDGTPCNTIRVVLHL